MENREQQLQIARDDGIVVGVSAKRTSAHRHSAHGRVFDGKRVEVASTTGLERFLDIADDLMREVFGFEPGEFLITDLSTLQDFVGVDDLEFAGILAKIIAVEKLTAYLLNVSHKRGGAKAKLLLGLGYRTDAPHVLESDLRAQHLPHGPTRTSKNAYGMAYEIEAPITTPSGRIVRFCSIWQIDTGSEVPRFITMYPR